MTKTFCTLTSHFPLGARCSSSLRILFPYFYFILVMFLSTLFCFVCLSVCLCYNVCCTKCILSAFCLLSSCFQLRRIFEYEMITVSCPRMFRHLLLGLCTIFVHLHELKYWWKVKRVSCHSVDSSWRMD